MNQQKGSIAPWLLVLLIIVILAVLFGIGYFGWFWFSKNKTVNSTVSSPSPTSSVSQNDTGLLISLCQTTNPGTVCEVNKIDGNYAYGSAGSTGGGAVWYAKKVNGTWTIVVPGVQDNPPCAQTADFPKSIVPTCM